jgi:hypothetical protein
LTSLPPSPEVVERTHGELNTMIEKQLQDCLQ